MTSPTPPFFRRLGAEVIATTVLALPLVMGQLSSMMMNVIDTVLAGRHSALTQAAVAIGTAVWSVAILIVIGSVVSLGYYLRVVGVVWSGGEEEPAGSGSTGGGAFVAVVAIAVLSAAASIFFGIVPDPLYDFASQAAAAVGLSSG